MSGWFKNLQGQLTELASEVLSEATEEIEDPESELQVLKKKLEEAEQQLLTERSNSELLQNKLTNTEEELYSKKIEFDTMTKKYMGMVESRDREIRSLQVLVIELEKELEELKQKSAMELAVLIQTHREDMEQLKNFYENKMSSSAIVTLFAFCAFLMYILFFFSSLLAEAEKFKACLKDCEEKCDGKEHEIKKLKTENQELTAAYNDLNEEYENHRAEHGSVVTSNRDLNIRIDTLKANLIEYEEKYELCKAENAETVKQLEKLTKDFENLRVSFESAKETSSFDSVVRNFELERLRSELEIVKHDRERLRDDVDRFTQSVKSIDIELNKLSCIDELMSQMNWLQAQQQIQAESFNEVRDWVCCGFLFFALITEARDKALSECERLRQHLLSMEESFTHEAIAAEERETELRSKIRQLELKTEETADNVISSSNAYEVSILFYEINIVKDERDHLKKVFLEKSSAVEKSEKALDDLRKIIRDINADHDSQTADYESQISKLKTDIQVILFFFNLVVIALVIDELETQLDEKVQGSSNSADINGHIDDEILRQLFLSYFTAEQSKKPEIALLLTSILKYSPEVTHYRFSNLSRPFAKQNQQPASRGWFGFGGSQKATQSGPSIAEQFISFLERESVRPTSHSLPIQSSLPSAPDKFADSEDLRSILDS
uniref:GRIP domain-containing protein n=1 Tax=Syphacia muris TaxID=451379 RepID=A0A0N5AYN0_9BILA